MQTPPDKQVSKVAPANTPIHGTLFIHDHGRATARQNYLMSASGQGSLAMLEDDWIKIEMAA